MVDLLVENGIVMSFNKDREVIKGGTVVIDGNQIVAVGSNDEISEQYEGNRVIDATNHIVLPGLINSHSHVPDILARGSGITDRPFTDWSLNILGPFRHAMTVEDHRIASALYCKEALESGITTFVEKATGSGSGYPMDVFTAKLDVYDKSGIRNIYAKSFIDEGSNRFESESELNAFLDLLDHKNPSVNRPRKTVEVTDTDEALAELDSLIEEYDGSADGRQSIWPAPWTPQFLSMEGLQGAYELAEKHDVMTTTNVSELSHQRSPVGQDHFALVEYLDYVGYLGERTLLAHCVHINDRELRLLAKTDTKVAHNAISNLTLGSGVARVPSMIQAGITVGIGTDNPSGNDTVNLIADSRAAVQVQKGVHQDVGIVTPEQALEMATIEGARSIGMEDELGSLEPGKQADLVLLDLDHPHLTPANDLASTIVYQAKGHEIDTVICNGNVVVSNGSADHVDEVYPDLLARARDSSREIIEKAGLSDIMLKRQWKSQ